MSVGRQCSVDEMGPDANSGRTLVGPESVPATGLVTPYEAPPLVGSTLAVSAGAVTTTPHKRSHAQTWLAAGMESPAVVDVVMPDESTQPVLMPVASPVQVHDHELHNLDSQKLLQIARELGFPTQTPPPSRSILMENIHFLQRLNSCSKQELIREALAHGVTINAEDTKEVISKTMIDVVFQAQPASPGLSTTDLGGTSSSMPCHESISANTYTACPTATGVWETPFERLVPPPGLESIQPAVPFARSARERSDEDLVAAVQRINTAMPTDFVRILDIQPGEDVKEKAGKNFRQLMKLLHPDKRTPMAEERAGGRSACEEAMSRVRTALEVLTQNAQAPFRWAQPPMPPRPPPPPGPPGRSGPRPLPPPAPHYIERRLIFCE